MFVNFRSFPPESRGYFAMAQLNDGSTHFSPNCDWRTSRDLFAMLMSNSAVAGASLIHRDAQGEHELAAFNRLGLPERDGELSGWRESLDAATRTRDERDAAIIRAGRDSFDAIADEREREAP